MSESDSQHNDAPQAQTSSADSASTTDSSAIEQQALHTSLRLFDDEALVDAVDVLHRRIEEAVIELLTKSPEKLMQILYRIDVLEERVDAVMKHAPVGSIASQIATLIIDRMREKVLTRQRYSQMMREEKE